jgi:hypothetical protein
MRQGRSLFEGGWLCLVLLCLALVGCDRDTCLKPFGYDRASILRALTPRDDEALALHSVELLLRGQFDEIENSLDPSIRNRDTHETLAVMASMFPNNPISVKTVDVSVARSRNSSTTNITLEYQFVQSWLLAQVAIQTKDGLKTITGFHVNPISEPVEVANQFTLNDKGVSQYAGLFVAICASGLTLYAFVLCVRTNIGKRKWVWLVVIWFGVCRLTVNWTTGQWFLSPLTVQVPPVMAASSFYGPWMLQIVAPLGAITFLRLRRRLASEPSPPTVLQTGPVNSE